MDSFQKTLLEMAEFTGRATGTMARDLADISQPVADAVRRGWHDGWTRRTARAAEPAPPSAPDSAPESA